jgi:predicted nucleotidyltransferase component of viral defense system
VTVGYPLISGEIATWAETNKVSVAEARIRFAQYAVLRAIAGVRQLQAGLVFKGGNALDFVWMPNRSTVDLDFSLDPTDSCRPSIRTCFRHCSSGASEAWDGRSA